VALRFSPTRLFSFEIFLKMFSSVLSSSTPRNYFCEPHAIDFGPLMTQRTPGRFSVSLPRKEFMQRAKEIWEELGFPELKLRMPWYGYSLGAWTPEDEEEAEIALRGDHFVTGEKAKNNRVKP
jgi:hypothetical protein